MGRRDIVRGDKDPAQVFRDLRQMLNGFPPADFSAQILKRKSSGLGLLEKLRVQAFQSDILHDGADDADPVERLDTGGAVRQDTDGAGRSDGCDRGMATPNPFGLKAASPY